MAWSTAFAGVVTYVFRQHTKQDDDRYALLNATLSSISTRQLDMTDTDGSEPCGTAARDARRRAAEESMNSLGAAGSKLIQII